MEITITVDFRYRVRRPEIGHVHAPWNDDLWNAGLGSPIHASGTSRQDTSNELIGPFRGCDVEYTFNHAVRYQSLHGSTTGARAVKHQHLIPLGFHECSSLVHRLRRIAEHGCGDQRFLLNRNPFCLNHTYDGAYSIGIDLATDSVDTGHIHNRWNHHYVFNAYIRSRVS